MNRLDELKAKKESEAGTWKPAYEDGYLDAVDACIALVGRCGKCLHAKKDDDGLIECTASPKLRYREIVRDDFYCGNFEEAENEA